MVFPIIPRDEAQSKLQEAIRREYPDAKEFKLTILGGNFLGGNVYYVEFTSKDLEEDEGYYYAFVDSDGCCLLDGELEVIQHMQTLLEKRRSFMQRLSDFDFVDLVGALIALPIVLAFVYLIVRTGSSEGVGKDFFAVVTLILGYYFGRKRL